MFFNGIDRFLAVCRSYLVAITIVIQDASQLKLHYEKEQAEVVLNLVGNIISGQVTGDSAKALAERFGKIMQDRESISINSNDTSISRSKQLKYAIPQATISALSAGEVVGMVADNPDQPIPQKMFHAKLEHDFDKVRIEEFKFEPLPDDEADEKAIRQNYLQIKNDIKLLVENEMERLMNTPGMEGLSISNYK